MEQWLIALIKRSHIAETQVNLSRASHAAKSSLSPCVDGLFTRSRMNVCSRFALNSSTGECEGGAMKGAAKSKQTYNYDYDRTTHARTKRTAVMLE